MELFHTDRRAGRRGGVASPAMARRYLIAFVLAAGALVAARQLLVSSDRAEVGANAGAAWIWGLPRGANGAPMVIFAAKDFDLGFKPVSAELEIAADEEYQLLVNGRGIAAGRYRERLDAYPVSRILRRGANRIVVEMRSSRGVGGLIVRLHIKGPGGQLVSVVSDDSWRIMRRYVRGVSRPSDAIWGEPVRVWGHPPTGRWRASDSVQRAMTLRQLKGGREVRPESATRSQLLGERWAPVEPFATEPLGNWVTFDFGRERTGFASLNFADSEASNGFLFYGLRKPKDGIENPDEVIMRPLGREHWTSAAPAKFRYLTVVGALQVTQAEVVPVVPKLADELAAREPIDPLFGVDRSLTLVSPVEHEIRDKLEGVPGLAGRKEG